MHMAFEKLAGNQMRLNKLASSINCLITVQYRSAGNQALGSPRNGKSNRRCFTVTAAGPLKHYFVLRLIQKTGTDDKIRKRAFGSNRCEDVDIAD